MTSRFSRSQRRRGAEGLSAPQALYANLHSSGTPAKMESGFAARPTPSVPLRLCERQIFSANRSAAA